MWAPSEQNSRILHTNYICCVLKNFWCQDLETLGVYKYRRREDAVSHVKMVQKQWIEVKGESFSDTESNLNQTSGSQRGASISIKPPAEVWVSSYAQISICHQKDTGDRRRGNRRLERLMNSRGSGSIKLAVFSRFILEYVMTLATRWLIVGWVCLNHLYLFTWSPIISFARFPWFRSSVSLSAKEVMWQPPFMGLFGFKRDNLKSPELSLMAFLRKGNGWIIKVCWCSDACISHNMWGNDLFEEVWALQVLF